MADTTEDGSGEAADPTTDLTPEPSPSGPPRPRRTLALWGVLAVLALGAGVLVVQSRDDDPPRLPIALGASASTKEAAPTSAAASTDMAMARWVTYVAGDDLPVLGGSAAAYRLDGTVSEADVRALAHALGLEGSPTRGDGAWQLQTDHGSLQVADGFGGAWSYDSGAFKGEESVAVGSPGSSGGGSAGSGTTDMTTETTSVAPPPDAPVDCAAVAGPVNGPCAGPTSPPPVDDCGVPADPATGAKTMQCIDPGFAPPPPTPPADLPSKDAARQTALDLLTATGMEVAGADVTVDGPDMGWFVNVQPRVDGQLASGLQAMVAIGSKGVVSFASGYLSHPERLGDYPTVDTRGAIDRLNAGGQGAYGAVDSSGAATSNVGSAVADVGGSTTIAMGQPDDRPVTTTAIGVAPDAPQPPVTIEPYPAPEPQTIVLHGAERILMLVPASNDSGDAYLVPGYRLTGDNDTIVEQIAVDDDSLVPPAPQPAPVPMVTTVPVHPAVGETKPDQ
jgi:hypothetical protein